MFDDTTLDLSRRLLQACRERGWTVVTAESCTGGLIAAALTEHAGSSDVVDRGFVTYSNAAKTIVLGVRADTLARVGAVSLEAAREMAQGALAASGSSLAIAVTGIAGPGGGSAEKPVGTVHIAIRTNEDRGVDQRCLFAGDRAAIRSATVRRALEMALSLASGQTALA